MQTPVERERSHKGFRDGLRVAASPEGPAPYQVEGMNRYHPSRIYWFDPIYWQGFKEGFEKQRRRVAALSH